MIQQRCFKRANWNKHIPLIIIVGVVVILIAIFFAKQEIVSRTSPCASAQQVLVCGANMQQYHSLCELNQSNIALHHFGSCDATDGVMCAPIKNPVCGADGKTYDNACVASRLAGVKVIKQGVC